MPNKAFRKRRKARIIKLCEDGHHIGDIAFKVGCSTQTVRTALKEKGMTARRAKSEQSFAQRKRVVIGKAEKLFLRGLSPEEIADKLGVKRATAVRYLRCIPSFLEDERRKKEAEESEMERNKESLRYLLKRGYSVSSAARDVGITVAKAHTICRKNNIQPDDNAYSARKADVFLIIKMFLEGARSCDVEKRFNVTRQRVSQIKIGMEKAGLFDYVHKDKK